MYSNRVVIPKVFQNRILNQLHKGHPGMERMKALARSFVYWPNMDNCIETYVKGCGRCATAAKMPNKTSLASWPLTQHPWERIHIDFAGPRDGEYFLVIVDAYSKWPEIYQMRTITSASTIAKLRETFARFGMPKVIVSDNGSQFTSEVFKSFCTQNGIQHIRTAPYHPQSNGQAERFVDTLKRSLTKMNGEGNISEILQTFLLTYRITPNRNTHSNQSPAQVMFGRRIRSALNLLLPTSNHVIEQRNEAMETAFNRHHNAKNRQFNPGNRVFAKQYRGNKSFWTSGVIIERIGKVNYNVLLDNNLLIRSHANQVKSNETSEEHQKPQRNSLPLDIILQEFNQEMTPCAGYQQTETEAVDPELTTRDNHPDNEIITEVSNTNCNDQNKNDNPQRNIENPTSLESRSKRARRPPKWMESYVTEE